MRWLLILITLLALNCATVPVTGQELSSRPIATVGWVVMDDDGYNWQLRSDSIDGLKVVGHCYKIKNSWLGIYLMNKTDFSYPRIDRELRSLHDCVEWVEHHAYGDYYI